jgi:hypothetical protein
MKRVGLQCDADVGQRVRWKDRSRTMHRSLTDAVQQLICNQQVIASNPIAGSGRNFLTSRGLWRCRRSGVHAARSTTIRLLSAEVTVVGMSRS